MSCLLNHSFTKKEHSVVIVIEEMHLEKKEKGNLIKWNFLFFFIEYLFKILFLNFLEKKVAHSFF